MFLKSKGKDVKIVERISLQWLSRKKYILEGVWKMDEQKNIYKQLINEELEYCSLKDLEFIYYLIINNTSKLEKAESKIS